jgi:hypothetical protein
MLFCIASVVALIAFPVVYMDNKAGIREFQITQKTVENLRVNDNIESAALNIKIIECNQWLIRTQYYNHTIFDPYIPDAVDSLQIIK